jgi:hypothetical protein
MFWKNSKLGTLATIREVKVELPNWDWHFFTQTGHVVYRWKERKK